MVAKMTDLGCNCLLGLLVGLPNSRRAETEADLVRLQSAYLPLHCLDRLHTIALSSSPCIHSGQLRRAQGVGQDVGQEWHPGHANGCVSVQVCAVNEFQCHSHLFLYPLLIYPAWST
jgi:hypothetical protein